MENLSNNYCPETINPHFGDNDVKRPLRIGIIGSWRVDRLPMELRTLLRIEHAKFIVGDCIGIDEAVIRWLQAHTHEDRVLMLYDGELPRLDYPVYAFKPVSTKEEFVLDYSDLVVFVIKEGQSKKTKSWLEIARSRGQSVLVIVVP